MAIKRQFFGYYFPNSVATLKGSYGNSWGPVFNRGGIGSVRHFPCKYPHKMSLVTCPYAFRLRRVAQNGRCGIRVRHFPCKLQRKMPLVTCPCAFRLRRVAQNGCRGLRVRHFPCKLKRKMWHVHVHFVCAGSHKTGVAGYGSGIFLVNYSAKCDMSMCISFAQGRTKRASRDTGPAFSL